MEGNTRKDEGCPQLLELRLGPPGEDWIVTDSNTSRERNHNSLSSLGYLPASQNSPWRHQTNASPFLQLHLHHPQGHAHLASVTKESSQPCSNRAEAQSADKNAFSPGPPDTAVARNGSTQKRTAPAPVVGWPPIRSSRKKIASGGSSSKPASDSSDPALTQNATRKPSEIPPKGLFVKINVEGIPIGRKVDLRAYDSYEKLSLAADKLFRGLLAAQSDSMKDKDVGGKEIGGLLDGSGEYTLVYEDNEGDRMLVGDVPWDMFVSTVKRLRVLKSSELPMLSREGKQGRKHSLDA